MAYAEQTRRWEEAVNEIARLTPKGYLLNPGDFTLDQRYERHLAIQYAQATLRSFRDAGLHQVAPRDR